MPTFAEVYNNAPAPSVHSTRYPSKSTHPTSVSHIPPDAKPLDVRRMSSSKAGMGRTRGTERSSKPEEPPVGPEFASRTQKALGAEQLQETGMDSPRKDALGAFERRRGSSSTAEDQATETTPPAAEKVANEQNRNRRSSLSTFMKKILWNRRASRVVGLVFLLVTFALQIWSGI